LTATRRSNWISTQFAKTLDQTDPNSPFQRLVQMFVPNHRKTLNMISSGKFDGPEITKIMNDEIFASKLSAPQRRALEALKLVGKHVFTNEKHEHLTRKQIVDELITSFQNINANYSLKMHILRDLRVITLTLYPKMQMMVLSAATRRTTAL